MSIWGKILGGAAGFALGGPLGALLGAVAGHAVDTLRDTAIATRQEESTAHAGAGSRTANRQIAFTIAVIALGAKMAKADGVVSRSEIDAFKRVFRIPAEEMRNVGRVFDRARRDTLGFDAYARQIAAMFRRQPTVLEELLDGLFHIAKADGAVTAAELDYLRQVARIFGLGQSAFERIRTMHLGPDQADPYAILGVPRDTADADVKSAWRKLARDNHPDKLIAKGVPAEFIDIATEKLATINAAYDRISRERGLN